MIRSRMDQDFKKGGKFSSSTSFPTISRSKESLTDLDRRSIPIDYYINRNKVRKERYQKTYIYPLAILVQWRENYPELSAPLSSMSFVSKLKVFQSVSLPTDRESADDRLHPSDLKLSTPRDIRLGEGGNSKLVRLARDASYFSSERFEFHREN